MPLDMEIKLVVDDPVFDDTLPCEMEISNYGDKPFYIPRVIHVPDPFFISLLREDNVEVFPTMLDHSFSFTANPDSVFELSPGSVFKYAFNLMDFFGDLSSGKYSLSVILNMSKCLCAFDDVSIPELVRSVNLSSNVFEFELESGLVSKRLEEVIRRVEIQNNQDTSFVNFLRRLFSRS
jgi:hypothetical protein